jgi:hypothetical protein
MRFFVGVDTQRKRYDRVLKPSSVVRLMKKLPARYNIERFINVLTRACFCPEPYESYLQHHILLTEISSHYYRLV